MYPYHPRLIENKLHQLFETFSAVVVSGARQVGKSRLLTQLFPHIPRILFDPIVDVENARSDPDLFLKNRRPPLLLDEIQYAPELIPAIKRLLEKDKKTSQFLITGSQQWEVMKNLSESLAGRVVFLDLDSFSLQEAEKEMNKKGWLEAWLESPTLETAARLKKISHQPALYEQIWRGFLPETHFIPLETIPAFWAAYQRTYIERDIRQMAEISDWQTFGRFLRLCAALTAQEINHSELGREIGITPQTASRWISLLKATFQWLEVPPYSGNAIKRISKKPKGYLTDTGLICFLQAVSSPEGVGGHPLWGALFETAVVTEILKQSKRLNVLPNFYHWRSHGGAEVDLLLERDGRFFPIEIKGSSHPSRREASGLHAFRATYPRLQIQTGLIVAPADSPYPLDDKTAVIPWDGVAD